MRKTMALLDEWESPEPSPYFLTRLRAHVKEEREKAPVSMFGWLRQAHAGCCSCHSFGRRWCSLPAHRSNSAA